MTFQRVWFCAVVAVIAAAFADPLVEFASNAGAFGAGNYTDHSNLDVIPALGFGLVLGIALLSLRVRTVLAGWAAAAPVTWRLLPAIFGIQIAVLYAMETAEQFIVFGHGLGGTIWLGAPTPISLAVHAAVGIIATLIIGRTLCTFTRTAARIVIFLRRAIALAARAPRQLFAHLRYPARFRRSAPLVCRIGERAPPLLTA